MRKKHPVFISDTNVTSDILTLSRLGLCYSLTSNLLVKKVGRPLKMKPECVSVGRLPYALLRPIHSCLDLALLRYCSRLIHNKL
jgi:hypothetical protein